MTNLVEQYKTILEALEEAKTTKTKLKVHLESAEKDKETLEVEILKLSGAKTVEEATVKLEALNKKINAKMAEAEELLEGLEDVN